MHSILGLQIIHIKSKNTLINWLQLPYPITDFQSSLTSYRVVELVMKFLFIKVHFSLWTTWIRMGGVELRRHSYLISALDGGEWSIWRLSCVTVENKPNSN